MRRRHRDSLVIIAVLLAACGGDRAAVRELTGATMGTRFSIKVPVDEPLPDADLLQREIDTLLAHIEETMSTYIVDSELSLFNISRSTDWQAASWALPECQRVAAISAMTGGAFDITVGRWSISGDSVGRRNTRTAVRWRCRGPHASD
jgi:thiamine biosynthesis lipoprotein